MSNERDDATVLLDSFEQYSPAPGDDRSFKIGVVQSVSAGACTIRFDGETVTGGKSYPCLGSYGPAMGDRVVVAPVGSRTSWLVLGAIGTPAAGSGPILRSPNGNRWRLGVTDAGAPVFTAV
jgi:hypothetical protein